MISPKVFSTFVNGFAKPYVDFTPTYTITVITQATPFRSPVNDVRTTRVHPEYSPHNALSKRKFS
ncbi:hypothetical protein GCM10027347_49860 [Larkinella harenae]